MTDRLSKAARDAAIAWCLHVADLSDIYGAMRAGDDSSGFREAYTHHIDEFRAAVARAAVAQADLLDQKAEDVNHA